MVTKKVFFPLIIVTVPEKNCSGITFAISEGISRYFWVKQSETEKYIF